MCVDLENGVIIFKPAVPSLYCAVAVTHVFNDFGLQTLSVSSSCADFCPTSPLGALVVFK